MRIIYNVSTHAVLRMRETSADFSGMPTHMVRRRIIAMLRAATPFGGQAGDGNRMSLCRTEFGEEVVIVSARSGVSETAITVMPVAMAIANTQSNGPQHLKCKPRWKKRRAGSWREELEEA